MPGVQESSMRFLRNSFPISAVPGDVGAIVAKERVRRRWSQARLASRSTLSRASIYRLENGARPSRADTLFRVAHALDMDIRELVPDWPEWDPIGADGHGQALRDSRRTRDVTLADLAVALGVSEATLSRHERGICSSPRLLRRSLSDLIVEVERIAAAANPAGCQ
jgi:transcriptional regulator with XRE-family HTH domain